MNCNQGPKGKRLIHDLLIGSGKEFDLSNWDKFQSVYGDAVAKFFEKHQDRFDDGNYIRVTITVSTDYRVKPVEQIEEELKEEAREGGACGI